MSIAEKLTTVAENQLKVYEAGQSSMVDESKIVEKTVSGNPVTVDDVSEIPHEVTVRLESLNLYKPESIAYYGGERLDIAKVESDGGITLQNVTPDTSQSMPSYILSPLPQLQPGTYCVSVTNPKVKPYVFTKTNGVQKAWSGGYFTLGEGDELQYLQLRIPEYEINDTVYYQLEKGTTATPYKPFVDVSGVNVTRYGANETDNPETYTANAEGVIEGVKSLSPYMTLVSDADVNIYMDYHKSWGMQTEYDRFWDEYQRNVPRPDLDFQYLYSGIGFTDNNFKPKKDIIVTGNATALFISTGIANLKSDLEACGVTLDLSQATNTSSLFSSAIYLTALPEMNLSNSTNIANLLSYCYRLKTVDKMIFSEKNKSSVTPFTRCDALEHIIFEGTLACNGVDLQWSTKLSRDSIVSLINVLSGASSGLSITLSKTAVNNAFETAEGAADGSSSTEWTNLVASKSNWTISLI